MATIERLSYSGLSTWLTCGEQYRLLKVEELPDKVGWYHAGGTAVHAMTEQEDLARFGGDPPQDFNHYMDQAVAELEALYPSRPKAEWVTTGKGAKIEDERWWRNAGPGLVAAWRRWLDASPYMIWITPDGEPAIELEMDSVFDGVPSKGFVDRILCEISAPDDPFLIVDLKSGKPPKDKVQLATYAEACQQRGWDVCYGGYYMAKGGILTGVHDLRALMGPQLNYQYKQVWTGIQAGVFPAQPSGLCANHCGVAKYCAWGGQLTDRSHLPYEEQGD